MGLADDRRELEQRNISPTKTALDRQFQLAVQAAQMKRREINLWSKLDAETDFIWGNYYGEDAHPLSYFDYYFTGQDIKIYIEGADYSSNADPGQSPFVELAYSVQQEKSPVYGFWSYTFDAVMRGTRIVSGMFRLVTTYPNRLTDLLSEAATSRKDQRGSLNAIRGLDTDEQNIQRYWDRNLNDRGTKRIHSVHPPFNLLIKYNLQPISLAPDPVNRFTEVYNSYKTATAEYTNINERLVSSNVNQHNMQIILNNVEITGKQVEFSPDGSVCSEMYSFFARDEDIIG